MKHLVVIGLVGVALSGSAWSQNGALQKFENLKLACKDASAINPDRQEIPDTIKVRCTDTRRSWAPHGTTKEILPRDRDLSAGIVVNKQEHNAQTGSMNVPVTNQEEDCPIFKEIEETLTLERSLKCGDVQDYKGSLYDYCLEQVNLDWENAKAAAINDDSGEGIGFKQKDTGSQKSFCVDAPVVHDEPAPTPQPAPAPTSNQRSSKQRWGASSQRK